MLLRHISLKKYSRNDLHLTEFILLLANMQWLVLFTFFHTNMFAFSQNVNGAKINKNKYRVGGWQ